MKRSSLIWYIECAALAMCLGCESDETTPGCAPGQKDCGQNKPDPQNNCDDGDETCTNDKPGESQNSGDECPTCKKGDVFCKQYSLDEIEPLIKTNKTLSKAEKAVILDGCKDGCEVMSTYNNKKFSYTLCSFGCDPETAHCKSEPEEETEKCENGIVFPECSVDEGVSKYKICLPPDKIEVGTRRCSDNSNACFDGLCAECNEGDRRCAPFVDELNISGKIEAFALQGCYNGRWMSEEICWEGCAVNGECYVSDDVSPHVCTFDGPICMNDENNKIGIIYTCEDGIISDQRCQNDYSCASDKECSSVCQNGAQYCETKFENGQNVNTLYVCRHGQYQELMKCDACSLDNRDCSQYLINEPECENDSNREGRYVIYENNMRREYLCPGVSCCKDAQCNSENRKNRCGDCLHGEKKCEIVTVKDPSTDKTHSETHGYDCYDGIWHWTSTGVYSCKGNIIGDCVNDKTLVCINSAGVGQYKGCFNGQKINDSCMDAASCSGLTCGECNDENDTATCMTHPVTHVTGIHHCVKGRWTLLEACPSLKCVTSERCAD